MRLKNLLFLRNGLLIKYSGFIWVEKEVDEGKIWVVNLKLCFETRHCHRQPQSLMTILSATGDLLAAAADDGLKYMDIGKSRMWSSEFCHSSWITIPHETNGNHQSAERYGFCAAVFVMRFSKKCQYNRNGRHQSSSSRYNSPSAALKTCSRSLTPHTHTHTHTHLRQ